MVPESPVFMWLVAVVLNCLSLLTDLNNLQKSCLLVTGSLPAVAQLL